jgi:hypothetical protein
MSDDDLRRRRRLTSGGPRRSSGGGNSFGPWLVTVLAAIAVIVGGWFLGQTLAHVFNGSQSSTQVARQQPTPAPVVTPLTSPSPEVTVAPTPTPTVEPTVNPTEEPTLPPTPAPSAAPTIAPTEKPTPAPTPTPTVAAASAAPRKTQPIARRPENTPAPSTATPATGAAGDSASRTVRAYIDALRRGDPQAAAAYLGNGVPDETFIDGNTRIASINSTRNSDGSYKVEVDMKTAQGEYFETFIVASTPNGNRILEKTAIQP